MSCRGYTREAYLALIKRARELIPGMSIDMTFDCVITSMYWQYFVLLLMLLLILSDVTISSDFISGFCSETEEEHKDTISLLQEVKYEQAFMVSEFALLPL